MASDAPGDRATPADLSLSRYARLSLSVGAAVALGVALLFVGVLAGGQPARPAPLYALLAFVVFATTALLAFAVLVVRRIIQLAVRPASVVRWSAAVGLVAGAAWLAGAVALQLGPARPWATVVDVSLPWAALLSPFGVWAAYTRYKRTVATPRVAAVAAILAAGGALVVADLAAFDLLALLPDVGRGVDERTARLFLAGAGALTAGQVVLAAVAVRAESAVAVPLALGALPLAGLAGLLAAGPGRVGLAAFAAGMGVGWLVVGWRLRGVADGAVPARPSDTIHRT